MKIKILLFIILLAAVSWKVNAAVVPLGQVQYATATISPGFTSAALTTSGTSLVGCMMPATFTGSSISFLAATTLSGSYGELDNSSGKISYNVTQGKFIAINPVDFYGVQFFKIVSSSSEGTTRNLVCSLKGI